MSCNPCRSPMLVREVQPPRYIYVGGDGRLKLSKQSTINTNPTFLPSKPLFLLPLFGDFTRVHRISTTKLRAVQSGLTQPIVAGFLRRGPSRGAGASGSKRAGLLSCVSRYKSASRGASCGVSPPALRVHEDVFV